MRLVKAEECPTEESLYELWLGLGYEGFVVDEIVAMRLHCKDDMFLVIETAGEGRNESVSSRVSFVLITIWTFDLFVESRWLSVGRACRCYLAGTLSGLDDIVLAMLADPSESKYYLSGDQKMSSELRSFMTVLAMALYPHRRRPSCLDW